VCSFCFFFQAEDGIRDATVTGVQTCALPISVALLLNLIGLTQIRVDFARLGAGAIRREVAMAPLSASQWEKNRAVSKRQVIGPRSEERRVGKEERAAGRGDCESEEGRRKRLV